MQLDARLIAVGLLALAADAHVARRDALHAAVGCVQNLGRSEAGEDLDAKRFCLLPEPAADVAQADDVIAVVLEAPGQHADRAIRCQLLEADRCSESGGPAAHDRDVVLHRFARHAANYNRRTMSADRRLAHVERIPMRWGDMDAMGHVNNTVYFRYMEQARISWFDALVPNEEAWKSTGIVIANASCNFKRAINYPGTVEIQVFIGAPGGSSVPTFYELRVNGELYADGAAT